MYFDHCPVEAVARAPAHMATPHIAVKLLSAVWHLSNPRFMGMNEREPYPGLHKTYTPPSTRGACTLADSTDVYYPVYTGPFSVHRLGKQTIADNSTSPLVDWAAQSTGNYNWVRAWGWAAALHHRTASGAWHPRTPMLWTLEDAPPSARPGPQTEPPVPSAHQVLDSSGYVNAVASYVKIYHPAQLGVLSAANR